MAQKMTREQHIKSAHRKQSSLLRLAAVSMFFLGFLYVVYLAVGSLPQVKTPHSQEQTLLKLPRTAEELKLVANLLKVYINGHFWHVLAVYLIAYIFLQSFAIPGSIPLSILGGGLFGFKLGLFLVCCCSGIGGSVAYCLSWIACRPLIQAEKLRNKVELMRRQVHLNRASLPIYLLFLRITPLIPNWLVNLSSPHLDVPLFTFFWTTFVGVIPLSLIHIQAGEALDSLTSLEEVSLWSPANLGRVVVVSLGAAVLLIVPRIWKPKGVENADLESDLDIKTE